MSLDRISDHVIVVGAVIEKDGKILLVQEKQPKAYGLWNTPAGWIDRDETAIEGAKREVKEETGYDVELNSLLGVYVSTASSREKIVCKIVFRGTVKGGELNFPNDELLDAKWFLPSEILSMKDSELRGIRKEIEDFEKGINYPIDAIRNRF